VLSRDKQGGCRRVVAGRDTDPQLIIGLLKSDGHLEGQGGGKVAMSGR